MLFLSYTELLYYSPVGSRTTKGDVNLTCAMVEYDGLVVGISSDVDSYDVKRNYMFSYDLAVCVHTLLYIDMPAYRVMFHVCFYFFCPY